MNELTERLKSTTTPIDLDGFDGYTDECAFESEEQDQDQFTSPRVIQGDRISFNGKAGTWVDRNKQPLPPLQLIVHDVARVVQKWGKDGMPAEPPIILGPNEKWPDVDAMNKRCPETEWRKYFDKLVGPYQRQKAVYLWDPTTMQKYTWPTSSNSGMVCVSDLVEKIEMMRQFKRVKAIPIIKLSSRLWSRRNGTLGPDLIVVSWMAKDTDGALLAVTEPAAIPAPKLTTTQMLDAFAGVKSVEPPTGKEATDDEIQY